MFRNSKLAVLCSLALTIAATPAALAQSGNQPQPLIVFQASQAQVAKVTSGSQSNAQTLAQLFSGAYHVGFDDGAWVIVAADGKTPIVVCYPKDVTYDQNSGVLSYAGKVTDGPLAGLVVVGQMAFTEDERIIGVVRVQHGASGGAVDAVLAFQLQVVWAAEQ
jgi:hypothetical protein